MMPVSDSGPAATQLPARIEWTVGIHSDEGRHEDSGLSLVDLGTIHEFGLGVPQRSFIRKWAAEDVAEINRIIQREMLRLLDGNQPSVVAERIALKLEGRAQAFIAAGRATPPLAEQTIARKGSSKPLIDTGALRASIKAKAEILT